MSEAATVSEFEAAREEAGREEADLPEIEEGQETEAPAKDWQKIAADKDAARASERARRRAAEKRAQELEERITKLESSSKGGDPLDELIRSLREDEEDPISDIAGLKKLVKQYFAQNREREQQESQQTAAQREALSIQRTMEEHEADFAADHPDYADAAKHYRAERQAELEALGYTGQALNAKLAQDLFGLVQNAIAAGRDPAEAVYNLAKRRGFKADASVSEAEDKLAKIAGAAQAGTRPAGRPASEGRLTWSYVSSLKGAARDAAWAKLREQERKSA